VTVRIPETVLLAVDRFAEMQLAAPSRSEAIRRLVEIGLESLKGKSAQK
jgi:metal-responsive CopG/Arc/MetJ family transcriptional regulator